MDVLHTTTDAPFDFAAVDRRDGTVTAYSRAGMPDETTCSALAVLLVDDELRALSPARPCGGCAAASRCRHPFATTTRP